MSGVTALRGGRSWIGASANKFPVGRRGGRRLIGEFRTGAAPPRALRSTVTALEANGVVMAGVSAYSG
ncbi:MAG: hypothetical protein ACKVH0_13165 [Alphaproteobacteria bacterium]